MTYTNGRHREVRETSGGGQRALRRLAHRRGNRYIIWVLGYEAKRAA